METNADKRGRDGDAPPESAAMPEMVNVSLFNRKKRRDFYKKHHIRITAMNRPFVKPKTDHAGTVA